MQRKHIGLLAIVGIAALLFSPFPALAQVAPPMGVLEQFSVLGNSGVTGSTGTGTVVNGDVGSSPTPTISNFPPSSVAPPFALHLLNDLTVQNAHNDAIAAYNFLAAQGPGTVLAAQLDGAVLTSGIYSFAGGAADLAALGTLTLNGPGIFVFQVDSALTANVGSNVIGTADPCSVFWRVGTSATLNGISFRGIVIADASISIGSGSNVTGKAIAGTGATGAVTMAGSGGNTIGGCACPVITVNPATLPAGAAGTAYSQTVSASGGTAPYTFAVTTGALPIGLSLNAATGAITGIPLTTGTFIFTITATDSTNANGCPGSRAYSIDINCPVITVSPPTLPNGAAGTAYSQTVSASGGVGPYTFAVTSGVLPAGLSLNAAGNITGTPTTLGTFNFTITATDTSSSCPGSRAYAVVIAASGCPVITLSPLTLVPGVVGSPYGATISATVTAPPTTFAVTSGALPAGLTLNSATGAITGTPTAAGVFNFTVQSTDANLCTGSGPYSIVIAAAPSGVPAVGFIGLSILVMLLAGAGLFVMNRFSI